MSTYSLTAERPLPAGVGNRPSLFRMTSVELRKMVDTRAGFWLLASVILLTIVTVVARVLTENADKSLQGLFSDSSQVAMILLPVVGILLVTSEWSQRTSLITFSLVPQRARVLAAKLAAGVVLSLVVGAVVVAISAVGAAFAGGPGSDDPATWSLPGWLIGQQALNFVTSMLMGIGFGAMLLLSAPAIVLYFVLPLGFVALARIPALDGLGKWLDGTQTLAPLSSEQLSATEWAQAGTTLAVWVLLPILIGLWRITRSEVN